MSINYYDQHFFDGTLRDFVPNPNYIPGCQRTYLIQRLEMPSKRYDGEWSFGCGLQHGGFSQEAWDIVRQLCRFDYMGSSEFEFGAIPQAFKKMDSNRSSLEAYLLPIIGHPSFPWNRRFNSYDYDAKEKIREEHILDATVFVLAPRSIRPHVEEVILNAAMDNIRLKEPANVSETVFGSHRWEDEEIDQQEWMYKKPVGWLELDNGFAFFANEDMWLDFCRLFDVTVPGWPDIPIVKPDFTAVDEALASCPKRDR